MSEQTLAGQEMPNWYTVSEEREWFEEIGRQMFTKAVRKAQEMVARGDVTLGPNPTRVSVEIGGEEFVLGVRQGNTDGANGEQRGEICCRCYTGGPPTICAGACCAEVLGA
jgi:hypothetical protein